MGTPSQKRAVQIIKNLAELETLRSQVPRNIVVSNKLCAACQLYSAIPSPPLKCGHSVCQNCICKRVREGLEPCVVCMPKITKKYKCSGENCGAMDIEKNLNICSTCTPQKTLEGLEQLISSALCSTCSLRKHSKNSHEIIDFSPILIKMQSLSMKNIIRQKNEANSKICDIDFANLEDFGDKERRLIEKCMEQLEDCDDSVEQKKLFENVEKFIENSKNARIRMHQSISNENSNILKNIEEFLRQNPALQTPSREVPAKRVCREKM